MIVDLLAEIIKKLLPDDVISKIFKASKEHQRNVLGRDLFLLYNDLVVLTINARRIVGLLELTKNRVELNSEYDISKSNFVTTLIFEIDQQVERLETTLVKLKDSQPIIGILHSTAPRFIHEFTSPKMNMLEFLRGQLRAAQESTDFSVLALQQEDIEMICAHDGRSPEGKVIRALQNLSLEASASDRPERENSTARSKVVHNNLAQILSFYFDSRKPFEQIENVERALEKIYEALCNNFSLVEILPKIGQNFSKIDSQSILGRAS